MANAVFPTKGNLINTKKSLSLAKLGFDLLDRKRNILVREMMTLIDTAKSIRGEIERVYAEAYSALQRANITLGVCQSIADGIPVECGVHI
ncbi:MAG: V-type ATP synthase subunit D, partial [Massilioclostridium sp.]|nr:V-type ATP synthase subunit D [Massilioclostridium sp.]